MAPKQVPFDPDAEEEDNADDKLEWDQDTANALGKFVQLSCKLGHKKCNILWKGDEMALQRTLNCLKTIEHLSMVDSNTAMWCLKLKEKETGNLYIHKPMRMPLWPLNETVSQISKLIPYLLIRRKFCNPTAICQYHDFAVNCNDMFNSGQLNGAQKYSVRLSETNYLSIIQVTLLEGQESDIVIYNVLQSNRYLTMGFLEKVKRLNVAIS
uniref:DNA2/NAM7 helicase-like C-terminal domain-containing protein n=1 Tax=Romanomermis culicivorax TaxID=13658 RepID=A0A915JR69_ROMCU